MPVFLVRLLSICLVLALLGGRLGLDWLHTKHTAHRHGPKTPQAAHHISQHEEHCSMCDLGPAFKSLSALQTHFLPVRMPSVLTSCRQASFGESVLLSIPGRSPPAC